jgi:hypothetical protein
MVIAGALDIRDNFAGVNDAWGAYSSVVIYCTVVIQKVCCSLLLLCRFARISDLRSAVKPTSSVYGPVSAIVKRTI